MCCAHAHGYCSGILHQSFPKFVSCYATCVGTPNTTNFGNSACMDSCCTSHGFTNAITGTCYSANASLSDAQAALDCARSCFGTSAPSSLCGRGNIQFDACSWDVQISPFLGTDCGAGGVNSQLLATDVTSVYAQTWGNQVNINSGSISATNMSLLMTCTNGAPYNGTASGTWNGTAFATTWTFGTTNGTMTITPSW
jgi:hypothetical protein